MSCKFLLASISKGINTQNARLYFHFKNNLVEKMSWKEYLKKNYFNLGNAIAFAGPKKIQKILAENNFKTSMKSIKSWLESEDSYTLLRSTNKKFSRCKIIPTGIDNIWDIDLADVSNISTHNDNKKFLLVVIDIFSRYLWVRPLKTKTAPEVLDAFTDIFLTTNRRPQNIRSDKGKEFDNRKFKTFMKQRNIKKYTTKNETKANYAERVIRTLKGLMYRYFLHNQTYQYLDKLSDLVHTYNLRPHRGLKGKKPINISKQNEKEIWKEMYVRKIRHVPKPNFKYKVGDQVRISHIGYKFQRDYQEKWTEEVFKVKGHTLRNGVKLYKLTDFEGENIDGSFYENELQKVDKPVDALFRIEKVVKRRRRNGKTELLIKWMGWPTKFNSWVDETDVTPI